MADNATSRKKKIIENIFFSIIVILLLLAVGAMVIYITRKSPVPKIEVASMDFTLQNITETRLSAKWDMSIRIPSDLPGPYICLQGDFQALFLYKNVTLATSSPQKYYNLERDSPQLLKVSAVVSEEDIGGLIGKDIMKDIKEKKEVQFGSRFFLTDCRQKSTGVMTYACNEANLWFKPGSKMNATMFGNHPKCISV